MQSCHSYNHGKSRLKMYSGAPTRYPTEHTCSALQTAISPNLAIYRHTTDKDNICAVFYLIHKIDKEVFQISRFKPVLPALRTGCKVYKICILSVQDFAKILCYFVGLLRSRLRTLHQFFTPLLAKVFNSYLFSSSQTSAKFPFCCALYNFQKYLYTTNMLHIRVYWFVCVPPFILRVTVATSPTLPTFLIPL